TAGIYTDSVMGIGFETSVKLTFNEKLSSKKDDTWQVNCFSGSDPFAGSYLMLFSKEIKPGYHILDQKLVHDNVYTMLKTQCTDIRRDSSELDGTKVMRYKGKNINGNEIFTTVLSLVKDGRQIMLIAVADSAATNSDNLQATFKSLRFIPHPSHPWRKFSAPDNAFNIYGPLPLREHVTKTTQQHQWISFDTATSTSYIVMLDTLKKYTWYRSDSSFWRGMITDTAGKQLVSIKDVVNGDLPGKEYVIRTNNKTNTYHRRRILVSGDNIYELYVAGEKDLLNSPEANAFFNEFRLTHPASPIAATRSKATLLLHDLSSTDSATRIQSYRALTNANFDKKDLPLLKEALFTRYYEPYDTTYGTLVNSSIARKLAAFRDPSVTTYVRDAYPSLTGERQYLQNTALYTLAEQHNTSSYTTLAELLKRGPIHTKLAYREVYALKDSLALTMLIYPALQSWIKDTLHTASIAAIILPLLDSGLLKKEALTPVADAFLEAATALLPASKKNDDYESNTYYLLELIGHLKTPAAYSLLKNYLAIKNKDLLLQVVDQLVQGDQPIPDTILNRLAADPATRSRLYNNLKDQKKTRLFPKQYATQTYFAESAIYYASDDEEGPIEKLEFLSKKNASAQDTIYTWYLYKVTIKDDDDAPHSYLGIAGGYPPGSTVLEPKKDRTGIYYEEEFDPKNIDKLFKAWLKSQKEDD
ncbi:MAG TPA: hypothetical protein VI233_16125, partial [Puia sp.]